MAINLMSIEPHKVSRDLSGYITYLYGPGKVGKTTFGSQMPNALILAFEKGYNALPNTFAQDVTSWADMTIILRQLKQKDVKEKFQSIIVDTIDIAAAACEKYIIDQNDVDTLNQIPYGQGWIQVKRELETTFRTITQLGYAVLFISHDKEKTFKRQDGTEYNQMVPTLSNSYNEIIKNMVDIYGYAHLIIKNGEPTRVLTLRSFDNSIDCGSRFRYMKPEIPFSYEALVEALNNAIEEEGKRVGKEFITTERNIAVNTDKKDFDSLMVECRALIDSIPIERREFYRPRLEEITNQYLGRGKKISQISRNQVEQLSLIVFDIRELLKENKDINQGS